MNLGCRSEAPAGVQNEALGEPDQVIARVAADRDTPLLVKHLNDRSCTVSPDKGRANRLEDSIFIYVADAACADRNLYASLLAVHDASDDETHVFVNYIDATGIESRAKPEINKIVSVGSVQRAETPQTYKAGALNQASIRGFAADETDAGATVQLRTVNTQSPHWQMQVFGLAAVYDAVFPEDMQEAIDALDQPANTDESPEDGNTASGITLRGKKANGDPAFTAAIKGTPFDQGGVCHSCKLLVNTHIEDRFGSQYVLGALGDQSCKTADCCTCQAQTQTCKQSRENASSAAVVTRAVLDSADDLAKVASAVAAVVGIDALIAGSGAAATATAESGTLAQLGLNWGKDLLIKVGTAAKASRIAGRPIAAITKIKDWVWSRATGRAGGACLLARFLYDICGKAFTSYAKIKNAIIEDILAQADSISRLPTIYYERMGGAMGFQKVCSFSHSYGINQTFCPMPQCSMNTSNSMCCPAPATKCLEKDPTTGEPYSLENCPAGGKKRWAFYDPFPVLQCICPDGGICDQDPKTCYWGCTKTFWDQVEEPVCSAGGSGSTGAL